MAESKNLDFLIRFDPQLPKSMVTDAKRLQQIIKNLLSNAFKFTHHGQVTLTVEPVQVRLESARTRISIVPRRCWLSPFPTRASASPSDKQQIIFEAFQQADGSTSRKYGGTGLGLAISRELSRLLGGEIRLISSPGRGSTFILYLPVNYTPPRSARKASRRRETSAAQRPAPALPEGRRAGRSERHSTAPTARSPACLCRSRRHVEPDIAHLVNEVGDDRD